MNATVAKETSQKSLRMPWAGCLVAVIGLRLCTMDLTFLAPRAHAQKEGLDLRARAPKSRASQRRQSRVTMGAVPGISPATAVQSWFECTVQTPVDAAEVALESWVLTAVAKDRFLRDVRDRHQERFKDFEKRTLRRYEKGVFNLFDARCWSADLQASESICGECHRTVVKTARTALGELMITEEEIVPGLSSMECLAGSPVATLPRCLRFIQRLASEAVLTASPWQGQDDD